jgi:hypothetical protein
MGIYDFFKGKCPNCTKDIDDYSQYEKSGDIQTKYFIENYDECFRDFYPQQKVPFAPSKNFIIGRTCCCHTIIKACFDNDLLLEYTVAYGKEKYDYIDEEMKNIFYRKYIPQTDKNWYEHQSFFKRYEIEKYIIQSAWHPSKISYYLKIGYTLDEICIS